MFLCRDDKTTKPVASQNTSPTVESKNATSRWFWNSNKTIKVKCRCDDGCDFWVGFYLNDDVKSPKNSRTYCDKGANDKGQYCWRWFSNWGQSNSYYTVTDISAPTKYYTIILERGNGYSRVKKSIAPGWPTSLAVVGSGSTCGSVYKP